MKSLFTGIDSSGHTAVSSTQLIYSFMSFFNLCIYFIVIATDWKVSRETVEFMESEYGSQAKQVLQYWSVFFDWDGKGEIYVLARKANFKLVSECNWKNTFFNLPNVFVWLYEDKHWQSSATTYTGDRHGHNFQYW